MSVYIGVTDNIEYDLLCMSSWLISLVIIMYELECIFMTNMLAYLFPQYLIPNEFISLFYQKLNAIFSELVYNLSIYSV